MITFIELWKAKSAWLELSQQQRAEYMTALGPAIQQLTEQGTQIVSWGRNDGDTSHRADYDFFSVWNFPSLEAAAGFEQIVEGAGWYGYFDQVNARGEAGSPSDVIGQLIAL